MPDRHHAPIPLQPRQKPKPFAEHLGSWYGVASIFVALFGAGAALHAYSSTKADASALAGKADAKPVESLSATVVDDHERLIRVEVKLEGITKSVDRMHDDLVTFAAAAGHPLPSPTKTP